MDKKNNQSKYLLSALYILMAIMEISSQDIGGVNNVLFLLKFEMPMKPFCLLQLCRVS